MAKLIHKAGVLEALQRAHEAMTELDMNLEALPLNEGGANRALDYINEVERWTGFLRSHMERVSTEARTRRLATPTDAVLP